MPEFESSVDLPCTAAQLFDFLIRPANLPKVSPKELQIQLIEAPAVIELGSRITVVGRRWGIAQQMTTEVVAFETEHLLTDEQRTGPFRSFRHTRIIDPLGESVRLMERIEFEPPGGLVGLFLSASRIREGLAELAGYRNRVMSDIFQALAKR